MATRSQVEQRRTEMANDLRQQSRTHGLSARTVVASVRELAERYNLSIKVVRQTLEQLIEDGVVYTIPRVGTFVGQRPASEEGYYLLLLSYLPKEHDQASRTQMGFEERIAQLGGTSLAMVSTHAHLHWETQQMPPIAGIFDYGCFADSLTSKAQTNTIPLVRFDAWMPDAGRADIVAFDNVEGGRQATQYLLGLRHRRIAFLALHSIDVQHGGYRWSVEREEGWRQALREAGQFTEGLAYHIERDAGMTTEQQCEAASSGAIALTVRPDVTAVVTANDNAAMGLFNALTKAGVPTSRWPAVVSFDNLLHAGSYLLTSFNLPWEEIGRTAANLLWERQHGQLTGPPQERRVAMRMIRRMTSQPGWSALAPTLSTAGLEAAVVLPNVPST